MAAGTLPAHTGGHFDCKVRKYAYEYAQKLQSWRGATKMKEVFDSLELTTLCNQTYDSAIFAPTPLAHHHTLPADAHKAFVSTYPPRYSATHWCLELLVERYKLQTQPHPSDRGYP